MGRPLELNLKAAAGVISNMSDHGIWKKHVSSSWKPSTLFFVMNKPKFILAFGNRTILVF
jgi:hypothetical protein